MASIYMIPLFSKPVVITTTGAYVTRRGDVVTVSAVSARHDFGCRGHYPGNIREGWHKSGRLYAGIESDNDIVAAAR